MRKSADAFRTISEVAAELGVPKHVLRFWEGKFPQIRPMKRGGGRRYYRPEDLELLRGVRHLLHGEGYTIKGVQKILREQGVEAVKQSGMSAGEEHDVGNSAAVASEKRKSRTGGRNSGGNASSGATGKSKARRSQKPEQSQTDASGAPTGASNKPGMTAPSPAERVGHDGAAFLPDPAKHDPAMQDTAKHGSPLQDTAPPQIRARRKAALQAVVKELEECRDVLRGLTARTPGGRSSKSKSQQRQARAGSGRSSKRA